MTCGWIVQKEAERNSRTRGWRDGQGSDKEVGAGQGKALGLCSRSIRQSLRSCRVKNSRGEMLRHDVEQTREESRIPLAVGDGKAGEAGGGVWQRGKDS